MKSLEMMQARMKSITRQKRYQTAFMVGFGLMLVAGMATARFDDVDIMGLGLIVGFSLLGVIANLGILYEMWKWKVSSPMNNFARRVSTFDIQPLVTRTLVADSIVPILLLVVSGAILKGLIAIAMMFMSANLPILPQSKFMGIKMTKPCQTLSTEQLAYRVACNKIIYKFETLVSVEKTIELFNFKGKQDWYLTGGAGSQGDERYGWMKNRITDKEYWFRIGNKAESQMHPYEYEIEYTK